MTSFRQLKWDRAKAYILAHPTESKEEQARGSDTSVATVASVRVDLIRDGLLQPSLKARQANIPAPRNLSDLPALPTEPPTEGAPADPKKPAGLLDHDAMMALADMVDLEKDALSDEEVLKRLIKQALRFAFDPRLHPDTRLSASQFWGKLRDMAKAKNLGPGIPINFEAGTQRLADLLEACGPEMTMAAVHLAFEVRPNADTLPAQHGEAAPTPPGSPAPAGDSPPVPPDASPTGPE